MTRSELSGEEVDVFTESGEAAEISGEGMDVFMKSVEAAEMSGEGGEAGSHHRELSHQNRGGHSGDDR